MIPLRAFALLLLIGCSTTAADRTPAKPDDQATANDRMFQELLQRMIDARWARSDEATQNRHRILDSTLAAEHKRIFENGDYIIKADILEAATPERSATSQKQMAETNSRVTIENVNATVQGGLASVIYDMDMRITFHGEEVKKRFRATETFVHRDGRWQSLLHTETVMPGEPEPLAVDTSRFGDYEGRYRLSPSVTYSVTRSGDKLYWGAGKQELIPESETTFGFKRRNNRKVDANTLYRVRFVRDSIGTVTHLRLIEFPGVAYNAIKVAD